MASVWYPKAFDAAFEGDIDVLVDTLKGILVDTADYTFSNAHDFLDDVTAGIEATVTLASVTSAFAAGVWTLDCANPTASAVAASDPAEIFIVYKDTGSAATSPLMLKLDLAAPITPNGGDITFAISASGLGTVTT